MLRLGLTGGIGAGKSTASRRLAERGAVVVDADLLAREVVEPGTDGLAQVAAAFGPGVLTPDGALDRAALGRVVFADDAARSRLNGILHPRIAALTAQRMRAAGDDAIVVHDVPLLVENGLGGAYHLVLVVHADAETRRQRLARDRGMDADAARARIAAQADDADRRRAADVWLDNSGAEDDLVTLVDRVWDDRLAPYAENLRLGRGARHPVPPGDDPAVVERLGARLRHAVGPAGLEVERVAGAGGTGVLRGQLHLTPEGPADALARLADAGLVPAGGPPAGTAGAGGRGAGVVLLVSADPGLAVELLVHGVPQREGARQT